jgi:hypothetical protein
MVVVSSGMLALLVSASTPIALKDLLMEMRPAAPPEDSLRVTEIMYHPEGDRDSEFIELQNTGPRTIDLTGVRFRGGIGFSFRDSHITTLEPGEYVVLVKDRALFARRYGAESIRIGGEYSGRLSNGGETVELTCGEDACISRFTYDDAWYPSTDGGGHSLAIRDPESPRESWYKKESWRPSCLVGGSPGSGACCSGGF